MYSLHIHTSDNQSPQVAMVLTSKTSHSSLCNATHASKSYSAEGVLMVTVMCVNVMVACDHEVSSV